MLHQLLGFPLGEIPSRARKLLAFSDNHQGAPFQAGHFNDFVQVLQLRAGLVAALKGPYGAGVEPVEAQAVETEKALHLQPDGFTSTKHAKFLIEQSNRRTLRDVLCIQTHRYLRKGCRLTHPNLGCCCCWRSITRSWPTAPRTRRTGGSAIPSSPRSAVRSAS